MFLYNTAIAAYSLGVRLAALWYPKAKQFTQGRKNLFHRLEQALDPQRKTIWIHVASLGEFEQGRPIIERIKAEKPEYQILVTFFSPSGYEIRKNYKGADFIFYLPLDLPCHARRFLDIVKPEIAIFVKYEFWLNMLSELKRRNIRTYIVSAIFRRSSIFFKSYGDPWVECLKTFTQMFVQDQNSKALLSELGFDNVQVAGDTRFDRVAQIAQAAKKIDVIERFRSDAPLFVAGSTWGPDEAILQQLVNDNPEVKFVIAPHEMDEQRIQKIMQQTKGGAVRYTALEGVDLSDKQVLVLDTVGILSSVYGYATWSYIGGGFGVGIHNTLEAATFGLPIAFGPNYHKFKEARDMISLGAACSVTNYGELKAWFEPLKQDGEALKKASQAAKQYTQENQGATQMIMETLFQ